MKVNVVYTIKMVTVSNQSTVYSVNSNENKKSFSLMMVQVLDYPIVNHQMDHSKSCVISYGKTFACEIDSTTFQHREIE